MQHPLAPDLQPLFEGHQLVFRFTPVLQTLQGADSEDLTRSSLQLRPRRSLHLNNVNFFNFLTFALGFSSQLPPHLPTMSSPRRSPRAKKEVKMTEPESVSDEEHQEPNKLKRTKTMVECHFFNILEAQAIVFLLYSHF